MILTPRPITIPKDSSKRNHLLPEKNDPSFCSKKSKGKKISGQQQKEPSAASITATRAPPKRGVEAIGQQLARIAEMISKSLKEREERVKEELKKSHDQMMERIDMIAMELEELKKDRMLRSEYEKKRDALLRKAWARDHPEKIVALPPLPMLLLPNLLLRSREMFAAALM